MINVLHVIDTARIGGPGKTIINSARFIDGRRFRVHVAAFTPPGGSTEFASAVTAAGIPFIPLIEHRRFDRAYVSALRAYIRTNQVSVVHGHGYRSDVFGWLAARGTGAAMVTTHHGWIRNNWRQSVFTYVARQLTRRFDGVEVVAHHLLDELPRQVLQSGRASVVHNAIVVDDYRRDRDPATARRLLGLDESRFVIGVVGRLSVEKGCLEAVDAFKRLAARAPQALLLFVGEGPLEPEIRRRAEAAGLAEAVRLLPHRRDVRPVFESIDVLVCPSHTEGLSNVIMEAMAYGRPVVATRVGGNAELVADAETGTLVPANDPAALAAAIAELIEHDARRRTFGESGYARVCSRFSFAQRMRTEERFYEQVLAARR